MDVLERERELNEPIEDLLLGEGRLARLHAAAAAAAAAAARLHLANHLAHIAAATVAHHHRT